MKRRRPLLRLAIVLGAVLLIPGVCLAVLRVVFAVNDRGSPELAAEWKAELSQYRTPEEAQAKSRDIIVLRFGDDAGGWVFGRCQDSHGAWRRGGGTVVVKDSKGQVRAFFGHVCGAGNLGAAWEQWSLEDFYKKTLGEGRFVEHHFP